MSRTLVLCCAVLATAVAPAGAAERSQLLRYPDLHGDRVVFTHGGDLWWAPVTGGSAVRLTSHPGLEAHARFSPDGRMIAFTGQLDGDEQVYVMPSDGGAPRQLTFYPARGPLPPHAGTDHQVYGWTPDGGAVLFRSMRPDAGGAAHRLYTVPLSGGLPEPLPMPSAGSGDLASDGRGLVYSPRFRDFHSWRGYRGGAAQDLYTFDLASGVARRLTSDPATDRDPMWVGSKVCFSSDRSGVFEVYCLDPSGGPAERLTSSDPHDVRWPSGDGRSRIVYELAGELHLLDVATGGERRLDIRVGSDRLAARPQRVNAADRIQDYALSPHGGKALFVARGDVFVVPVADGTTPRNLTSSPGAHDRMARWSPDGTWVAFVSDRDGEDALWVTRADGSGTPLRLAPSRPWAGPAPQWSPTGTHIAAAGRAGGVEVVEVASGTAVQAVPPSAGELGQVAWAPGGWHLAVDLRDASGRSSVWIWSMARGTLHRVSPPDGDDFAPTWDPAGDLLYLLSRRGLSPQVSNLEWNFAVNRSVGVYAVALRRDVPNPLRRADEEPSGPSPGADRPSRGEPLRIDLDGIADRVVRFPLPFDNYEGLHAVPGRLLYLRRATPFYGRPPVEEPELRAYDPIRGEETVLVRGARGFRVSADGSRAIADLGGGWAAVATSGPGGFASPVIPSQLEMTVDPVQEWTQMFDEAWRAVRDLFYAADLHGVDWEGVREHYRPLVQEAAHRSDLDELLSRMLGELAVGHALVQPAASSGDRRPRAALLGAVLTADHATGGVRLARVYRGRPGDPAFRAPLAEPGLAVPEGSFLLAVNGTPVAAGDNPYQLLRHLGDQRVEITVGSSPAADDQRRVVVEPVADEAPLAYAAWVEASRRRVEELGGGRAGYLHLPDTGPRGIREFMRGFYSQLDRDGLVLDLRGNPGGNTSEWILERLRRPVMALVHSRPPAPSHSWPGHAFGGHLVCLVDEATASDAEILAHMLRRSDLAPLVGTRTWGAAVGADAGVVLVDGSRLLIPRHGLATPDGRWIIEGVGVPPDIEVANDVEAVISGRDPQLERAVEVVLERLRRDPPTRPSRPADPRPAAPRR